MTDQDKKPFAALMAMLGEAFFKDVSKPTMAIYFQYLTDYRIEAIKHAVDEIIKTHDRFPTVKVIREHAATYRPPIRQQQATDATQIAEFTAEQIEESKKRLREIVEGLTDHVGLKGGQAIAEFGKIRAQE